MLSATKVKSIKKAGEYADMNGLYLRVDKSVNKTWIFRYTFQGRRSKMGLGPIDIMSLAEAREKVLELKKMVKSGIHPNTKPVEKKRFSELATEYIEMKRSQWTNAKHAQQWTNTLTTYAFPFIGSKTVDQIATKDIKAMLDPIWVEKPETATRVRSRVENIIDYQLALDESERANPAALKVVSKVLPDQKKKVKHFNALHYNDVPKFYSILGDEMSHKAIKLTILTASRTAEVIGAEWYELDTNNVWNIPPERYKARKWHRVPLPTQAIAMLSEMHDLAISEYIFPSPVKPKQHISNIAMLKATKNINPDITVHGFRSSFTDWVAEQTNYGSRLSEAALGHVIKDKTEAAYHRTDLLEKRRQLMQEWADFVTGDL